MARYMYNIMYYYNIDLPVYDSMQSREDCVLGPIAGATANWKKHERINN